MGRTIKDVEARKVTRISLSNNKRVSNSDKIMSKSDNNKKNFNYKCVRPPNHHLSNIHRDTSCTTQKLAPNKKYTVIRHTVLIPCKKRKFPATVRVHFSTTTTTTPAVPASRSIQHGSYILQKLLRILNTTDNYTVAREAHCVSNIKWAAIDSGASGNYYPSSYVGEKHNPLAPKVVVGFANNAAIKSKAQDTIQFKNLPTEAKICHKFDEITTPLISVSQLCQNKMTVTFNDKGVSVNNSEGETVIRGHLDLGNNLYMVPADDTYVPTVTTNTPTTRNVVKISQH